MFDRGPYMSYAICGLPYYVGGRLQHLIPWQNSVFKMAEQRSEEMVRNILAQFDLAVDGGAA